MDTGDEVRLPFLQVIERRYNVAGILLELVIWLILGWSAGIRKIGATMTSGGTNGGGTHLDQPGAGRSYPLPLNVASF